ncbi:phage tail tube assembly chaperone [Liquorilactobacillus mali]|uniref:phage tail tube assembly chaperone n=1 Tax=Liquorilactobacillus mali TaxID=1618 RepID=UPI00264AF01F|nr:phage tail tube assembly chaperone [Liquorilactobacillus mali]MDN7145265.1 phage tail tube assembly chaperone [Liquorilactobacillus mali]
MAKVIEFDGSKIGTDKQYEIVDTSRNVKKMAKHYSELLEKVADEEDGIDALVSSTVRLSDVVDESIADILGLNKKEKDGLQDYSFSDKYDFFNECLRKFIGISLPSDTEDTGEKEEDPKLEEEGPSGN